MTSWFELISHQNNEINTLKIVVEVYIVVECFIYNLDIIKKKLLEYKY